MRKVTVSICCITYNHALYISEAIEGFLMQETDFSYEILIHDDASTDGTAEIIKEYQRKYPDKILAVLESENQMSKGRCVDYELMASARGEYIALNEGDDCWSDSTKLQRQIQFLKKHKNCSLVTTGAFVVGEKGRILGEVWPSWRSRYFSSSRIIENGGGMFATNTMVFPKKYIRRIPAFYKSAPVGDYPLTVLLSVWGSVYFMKDKMGIYRKEVARSWSEMVRKDSKNSQIFCEEYRILLNQLDVYTRLRYHKAFELEQMRNQYLNQVVQENLTEDVEKIKLMKSSYRKLYKKRKFLKKVRDFMCIYFPKWKEKAARRRNEFLEEKRWRKIL